MLASPALVLAIAAEAFAAVADCDASVALVSAVDANPDAAAADPQFHRQLKAALADSGVAPGLAAAAFPRGALDLALAYHRAGDAAMLASYQAFIAAGDSDGSVNLFKTLGADITDDSYLEPLIARYNELLDMEEALLKKSA